MMMMIIIIIINITIIIIIIIIIIIYFINSFNTYDNLQLKNNNLANYQRYSELFLILLTERCRQQIINVSYTRVIPSIKQLLA